MAVSYCPFCTSTSTEACVGSAGTVPVGANGSLCPPTVAWYAVISGTPAISDSTYIAASGFRGQVERWIERTACGVFQRLLEGGAVVALDIAEAPGLTLVGPVLRTKLMGSFEMDERVVRVTVQGQVGGEVKLGGRLHVASVQSRQARGDPLLIHQKRALRALRDPV